jgi:sugar O-acyltransferase (sialic acid O-acetyltransferase NeuD family)
MVILGASGLAKEIATVLLWDNYKRDIVFFDNVSEIIDSSIKNKFKVLTSEYQLKEHFEKVDNTFCIGVGNPKNRNFLMQLASSNGGKIKSIISSSTMIGEFGTKIAEGAIVLSGVTITASVSVGTGCLINKNSVLSHDVKVGEYVEISPGVKLLGDVEVGPYTSIGTNAVILPKVIVGRNCIIGAGSVVTKNVADGTTVIGIPAKIK